MGQRCGPALRPASCPYDRLRHPPLHGRWYLSDAVVARKPCLKWQCGGARESLGGAAGISPRWAAFAISTAAMIRQWMTRQPSARVSRPTLLSADRSSLLTLPPCLSLQAIESRGAACCAYRRGSIAAWSTRGDRQPGISAQSVADDAAEAQASGVPTAIDQLRVPSVNAYHCGTDESGSTDAGAALCHWELAFRNDAASNYARWPRDIDNDRPSALSHQTAR